MAVTAVVGAQWGDEAKGKFVDILAQEAAIVARFNGGDNAGHTVVNQYGTFKVRLTPNGFANPDAHLVIGPGVVINLTTLAGEFEAIQSRGINLEDRLWISPRCHVVMPYHPIMEEIHEKAKGGGKTGTTRRGMGPVYADKVSYNGIRLADLFHESRFKEKLSIQLAIKNRFIEAFQMPALELEQVQQQILGQFSVIRHTVREPFGMIQEALQKGANLVLEGAQGTLLDNTWGTYPYVTASVPLAGGAAAGLGISPRAITRILGVAKAYTTRVGGGPMPSELLNATGQRIAEAGAEYGTVTGRPRRCGWYDASLVRFSTQVNGFTGIALTKLDVLDEISPLEICTGYHAPGSDEIQQYWEGDAYWLEGAKPVTIQVEGWQKSIKDIRDFNELPHQAISYIHKLEELAGVPIDYVSVGPEREAVILRQHTD